MEVIIKAFSSIFFLLLLAALGLGLISCTVTGRNADAFAADAASRIEAHNYSPAAIAAAQEEAKERGYELSVEVLKPDAAVYPTGARLALSYDAGVPVIGAKQELHVYTDLR